MHIFLSMIIFALLLTLTLETSERSYANQSSSFIIIPENKAVLEQSPPICPSIDENSEVIKLVVWNIAKAGKPDLAQDLTHLADNNDLILIQEATNGPTISSSLDPLCFGKSFAKSFIYDYSSEATGVLTAWNSRPTKTDFLRSSAREPLLGSPKMILLNWFKIPGRKEELLVANVHAINFVNIEMFRQQMVDLFARLVTHRGPMIVAGDFNTWSAKRTKILLQLAKQIRLEEMSFHPDFRTKTFGYALDHAFYRGLIPTSGEVPSNITSSDHAPILAKFVLEPEKI
jgi:endonuclease/exonuclease/phosphatase (EEP) superfamily protein YafD